MLITALVVVLSQTSPPLVPAPELEAEVVVPDDVGGFSEFVDRHLLSITLSEGPQVRTRARTFRLVDDDFETAFALVPEAAELAHQARRDALTAQQFNAVGMSLLGASGGATLVAMLLPTLVVPILVGAMIGLVISLVATLVAVPLASAAQDRFVNAVSAYNHGLLDLRTAAGQKPYGGMTVSF